MFAETEHLTLLSNTFDVKKSAHCRQVVIVTKLVQAEPSIHIISLLHVILGLELGNTGWARLIRSLLLARISFKLSGNSN